MAEILESKLYEAAAEGNVTIFLELIRQDHLLLDRVLVNYAIETPLHVAAMLGHTDFVKEIIQRKPEFTRELDSRGSSPLHLASAKGYVDIVKALLFVNPDMCLAVDLEERNPLHFAAMKGHVHVLNELVRVRPQAARVTVSWGETILHLCVKYGQFESFKTLVEVMNNQEFVNAKDDYGMTVLHLAVAYKQIETIKFLLTSTSVEVNGLNANGLTAMDVLAQSRRGLKDFDIAGSLRDAGALRAAEILHWKTETTPLIAQNVATNQPGTECQWVQKNYKKEDWLTRKRDSLMVVASLMATMSFQAGLTPPGGLWQDDFTGTGTERSHEAGHSIIADTNQSYSTQYLAANTKFHGIDEHHLAAGYRIAFPAKIFHVDFDCDCVDCYHIHGHYIQNFTSFHYTKITGTRRHSSARLCSQGMACGDVSSSFGSYHTPDSKYFQESRICTREKGKAAAAAITVPK
ncbi:hypothetical protein J1N35_034899 [Gossypium stocksii]|uniref:PGG domain-containing protein n=1 Tax=Gossypium stocksii TaxID=47602 RepID=A0A9D3UTR0_9ROSI|nr:hypothetical protein J1N35_034899 [Gossypium stocksii]